MPFTDNIGFLMSRTSGLIVRATNDALAEQGLRVRQLSVLSLICESSAGESQRSLAGTLGLDPSQVVALVDELVRAGLAERRPSTADRRTKSVVPTERGRAVQRRAEERAETALREVLGALSETELATLRTLLRRAAAASIPDR